MSIRMEVRGLDGLRANFLGFNKNLRKEILLTNRLHGTNVVALAQELAPVRTGLTKRSIKYELPGQGLTVVVFADPQEYEDAGEDYYAPYVEFGTDLAPAQPFLFPAFETDQPYYKRDIADAYRRAERRIRVRRV